MSRSPRRRPFLPRVLLLAAAIATGGAPREPAASQPGADPFHVHDIPLRGRLRHLTLARILPGAGEQVVAMERDGAYPEWSEWVEAWKLDPGGVPSPFARATLPSDTVLYGFVPPPEAGPQSLLVVRSRSVEIWPLREGRWQQPVGGGLALEVPVGAGEPGEAAPFEPLPEGWPRRTPLSFLLPDALGVQTVTLSPAGLRAGPRLPIAPRGRLRSSSELVALDVPFWFRSSLSLPLPATGSMDGAGVDVFWPWRDEVTVLSASDPAAMRTLRFGQFTEAERDDDESFAIVHASDLDGDGRTDFLVNKFRGAVTSFQAKTEIFFNRRGAPLPSAPLVLKPQGNRAGGAQPVDLDHDGRKEILAASAQFNVWAIVRALLRGRVNVTFSFYLCHPEGYHLDAPDFSRELAFAFNVTDQEIEGIFPTMDGDFNGDGYPDALYSPDRKELRVLLQAPGQAELFPDSPSASMRLSLPRGLKVGDLDGNGLADAVLFDTRADGNRRLRVLVNTGALR